MPAPHPIVIGHRGASGYRPEHTRAAYELAIALGADAVEPDLVATRDGVLVIRHENEIGGTTDVALRPEFADRRTTKEVDGTPVTGWFTEDFTWAELATLRARERMPRVRPHNATFDGRCPLLRLSDLFTLVDRANESRDAPARIVAEIKHPTYFAALGLPLDELFAAETIRAGWAGNDGRLIVECFERGVLGGIRQRGVLAPRVYLMEAEGAAFDRVARDGDAASSYADERTPEGLAALAEAPEADRVEGISVDKSVLLAGDGRDERAGAGLVAEAHRQALSVYTWTLRPENRFLAAAHRRGDDPDAWGDWRAEFTDLAATGLDGVFTDCPDLACDALAGGPGVVGAA